MWQMMLALNKVCLANGERSLSDSDLKQIFDVWYPHLEQQIRELLDAAARNTEKAADAAPQNAPLCGLRQPIEVPGKRGVINIKRQHLRTV